MALAAFFLLFLPDLQAAEIFSPTNYWRRAVPHFDLVGEPVRLQQTLGLETALSLHAQKPAAHTLDLYRNPPLAGENADRWAIASYWTSQGAYYSDAWVVISGWHESVPDAAGHYAIRHPTADNCMQALWGDVDGPVQVIRPSGTPNSYQQAYVHPITSAYVLCIEQDGGLTWGASSRERGDTRLRRVAPGTLATPGTFCATAYATRSASGGTRMLEPSSPAIYYVDRDGATVILPPAAQCEDQVRIIKVIPPAKTATISAAGDEAVDEVKSFDLKLDQSITVHSHQGIWRVISVGRL